MDAFLQKYAKHVNEMSIGVFELENWLKDVATLGLAGLQQQEDSYFENIAGRMVDLRLSNIARRIRGLVNQKHSSDWLPSFSKEVAELYLFVRQFKQYPNLSESQKMGWLQQAGISLKKKDVLELQDPISDYWIVLGQREGEDDRLRWRRTWLWGEGYQDAALILDFAWGGNPFEGEYKVGAALQADLCQEITLVDETEAEVEAEIEQAETDAENIVNEGEVTEEEDPDEGFEVITEFVGLSPAPDMTYTDTVLEGKKYKYRCRFHRLNFDKRGLNQPEVETPKVPPAPTQPTIPIHIVSISITP